MKFERPRAVIGGIGYYLPEGRLTNEELANYFPDWKPQKIASKTGILSRHVAAPTESSVDLAEQASWNLLRTTDLEVSQIDYIIFCTQTPDFVLPSSSCLLQDRLGIPNSTGAVDLNQGCSGYVYGLSLATALIESGQARNIVLVTADTYTKLLNRDDRSTRTIFGDGATSTWIKASDDGSAGLDGFMLGTDGSGMSLLITPNGNIQANPGIDQRALPEQRNLEAGAFDLFMDGPAIFQFTLREIPKLFEAVLKAADVTRDSIDYVVPHQANEFMLVHLREALGVPEEEFCIDMSDTGNTISSSIPLVLARMNERGLLDYGKKILLMGFGVGLSWGGVVLTWGTNDTEVLAG